MQATPGAIDRVNLDNAHSAPNCRVIRDEQAGGSPRPTGNCGSGIISTVAALHRQGILLDSGAFRAAEGQPFLHKDRDVRQSYVLVEGQKTEDGLAITISQKDIHAVQLGKAALRTGIEFLLRAAGLDAPAQILLAGAFGSNIDPDDLIRLGILPPIDRWRIRSMGNAASSGTVMVLSDPAWQDMVDDIAASITSIDLAAGADFHKAFIDNLGLASS